MERRYQIRFRLAPGQVAYQDVMAASPAKAVQKALELFGPDSAPIYEPRRPGRKAKHLARQSPEIEALFRNLLREFR